MRRLLLVTSGKAFTLANLIDLSAERGWATSPKT
jgi:hypothetical protein